MSRAQHILQNEQDSTYSQKLTGLNIFFRMNRVQHILQNEQGSTYSSE
jgi:hypothetical protein